MCEYCKNIINENDYTGWEDNLIVKTENGKFDLRIFTGCDNSVFEDIKFCPMCGRNLKEVSE